jgi:hypothetical protein
MSAFAIRAILSGIIIALIALVGKKAPAAGALIASLPLISILGMIWLWRDTADPKLLADHAEATFWYVLPSLPMFLLIPALLRNGYGFWSALAAGIAVTIILYLTTILIAARFGVRL